MPKDRRSSSFDRCRVSPYSRCCRNADKGRPKSPSLPVGNENEWEEARCPICMEHPHNAVLLLCSSREKGCRPFMCDTSSRHSNCLDQFRKSTMNADTTSEEGTKLVCPLCRGQINGWIVVDPARHFMNSKTRSCSSGTCDFAGNYSELRKHARREHPFVRPTEIDPAQEFEWRNLEEDMEQQDMLNMQFEFDDDDEDGIDDELMDGIYELASPIWDYDLDFQNFLNTFGSEFESVFPELDWDSGDGSGILDDWDDLLSFASPNESENTEFGRSRGTTRTQNRLSARPRENPATSRVRTNTHRRQRSNAERRQSHRGRPSSHNRQEQITTLVDFHELRSNLP